MARTDLDSGGQDECEVFAVADAEAADVEVVGFEGDDFARQRALHNSKKPEMMAPGVNVMITTVDDFCQLSPKFKVMIIFEYTNDGNYYGPKIGLKYLQNVNTNA
jgi:hypothetical protein